MIDTKKYADAHGIKIINASRKTKLDVFEKVNLENYLWYNVSKIYKIGRRDIHTLFYCNIEENNLLLNFR